MIQPYRITELPWQADPLPGLLAIRGMGHPVLLDSAASGDPRSRYSILAADPAMVISAERNESGLSTIARLRAALQDLGPASWPDQLQLPFGAGALGFVSYDFGRALESLPVQAKADISLPLLQMGIYHWSVISDNQARRRWLVCHPRVAREYEEQVLMRLGSRDPSEQSFALRQPFAAEQRKDEYLQSFERIQHYIRAGDCYQVNLAQRFSAPCQGDPLAAYRRLRRACPTPFAAYLESPDHAVLSLSPERFLKVVDGQVETRPIKGTRPRGTTAERDTALAEELRSSPKDRAENLMIVDLLRNDLGRVCAYGSVRVPELFSIERYPNVHHLVSSITGTLAPGEDALSLLAGAFPGGSITGAPKIRAMQIIEELEPVRRSLYCGSIGYIGCEGQMDMNIAIRTLVHQKDRLYCWGGGGIVADSDGEAEYQESLTKVRVLMESLG
ncbi:aminodeoxychorismate synthase component I [Halopseudomonas pertucinogena]|uniref:aminodeoxychorismate synthase n=1 Tax=Halopseudomonas pertucinogena TaxID=86175 RepID=A0ABQ2CN28_9GAMM|nr:aminodeoxychorismate synthase component I [Halopseudomonas pertucinogena]GGI96500.1 aminodeoxychorismate synthase, component I [Halopseudomonas pertucinogena]